MHSDPGSGRIAGPDGGGSRVVIVMGVSGSGKSTVGAGLARFLGVPFLEGDVLHSASNRLKMASGHPLDDADRRPWLEAITVWIRTTASSGHGGVAACSALKRAYRDQFRHTGADVWFLYLALDREVAERRLTRRKGHFMPPELLDSQYATLDPLHADEPGVTIDINDSESPAEVLAAAVRAVSAPQR
ncbi:gluconokinase [Streptomyces sp. 5-8]|uniref:Gluconokinase n=1 Tax=Streptomyces musisoli TaxID=2802280 RepID=A0ABS1P3G0_9ACTN|nr:MULTISPECIES: gluconokinase [Streptomyces]MBL1106898.1 gluconokinase [Streptomyces musisoli]